MDEGFADEDHLRNEARIKWAESATINAQELSPGGKVEDADGWKAIAELLSASQEEFSKAGLRAEDLTFRLENGYVSSPQHARNL